MRQTRTARRGNRNFISGVNAVAESWGAPSVDFFGKLGAIGDTISSARKDAERKALLASAVGPDGSVDYQKLMAGALKANDPQTALLAARQAQDSRDFQFRKDEAARSQGNTDRAFNLQQQTATEAARGYDYREVDDGNGGKRLVRIHKQSGAIDAPNIAGVQTAPNNPFGGGKFNDSQGKAAGFADRMLQSESILQDTQNIGTDLKEYAIANAPFVPDIVRNKMHSEQYQKFEQAKRDFINAQLRRESGATIQQPEFDSANKQYFPKPGDTPDVIAQKNANRRAAVEAMGREGGPSYAPKYTYDPQGRVTVRQMPQQQAGPQQQAQNTPAQNQQPRQAADGKFYVPDPARPGKYLQVVQ